MPDAEVDSDGRSLSTRVDVAAPADEAATLGPSTLRARRAEWIEPSDDDAVDEMVDTLPRRAVFAAPSTTPLALGENEQEDAPAAPVLQADGPEMAHRAEGEAELPPPLADAPAAADAGAADAEVETSAASSAVEVAEPELHSVAPDEPRVEAPAPDAPPERLSSDDAPVAEFAPASEPLPVADAVEQLGEITLIPDAWHEHADDMPPPAETLDASDGGDPLGVTTPDPSDDVPMVAADEAPEPLEAAAPVAPETQAAVDDVATQAALDEPAPVIGEMDATLLAPAMSADETPTPSDHHALVVSEPGEGTEGAPVATRDAQETPTVAPPESATQADVTMGLLYGYASAPTRPRSAVAPSPFVPLPPPRTMPPSAPLPPISAPPETSSWSVPLPTSPADSAPDAGPLYPPLPVAAASTPPDSSQSRRPSIAGIDTRVPQEYWIEDDPMEQARHSLGLSGERPVVREAGRPLPKPRRFKRPPRVISLLVFFIVLAIILLSVTSVVLTVAHLLAQPAATPTVVPTHTALPTSTPTQNS